MMFVVDVNVVLSALIRDSVTRRLIIESGLDLYFPELSLEKIIKYKGYVEEKAGIGEKELLGILSVLFTHIMLMPAEKTREKWGEAMAIMEKIDPEDVVFVSAALGINSAIWSDDRDFERQGRIKVFKTKELARLFLKP